MTTKLEILKRNLKRKPPKTDRTHVEVATGEPEAMYTDYMEYFVMVLGNSYRGFINNEARADAIDAVVEKYGREPNNSYHIGLLPDDSECAGRVSV